MLIFAHALVAARAQDHLHFVPQPQLLLLQMQQQQQQRGSEADAHWWRRMRLVLLKHVDRLDTLMAVHQGMYEPAAYEAFRDASLTEAAVAWVSCVFCAVVSYSVCGVLTHTHTHTHTHTLSRLFCRLL